MSTFDLAIPGGGDDDTWEGFERLLNVLIRRKLCDLRLLKLRHAVFRAAGAAARAIVGASGGSVIRLLPLMSLIVDQSIDEVAQKRQIMVACPRPRAGERGNQGSAALDRQASRGWGPAELAEFDLLQERLMGVIGRMPADDGIAFYMKILGCTTEEIMEAQGVARTTVFDRIKRAKEAVAADLRASRPPTAASQWE